MSLNDASTPFGARAERRLREERIGWLVTVRADGTPQPSPVWFLWDGETILLFSQPGTQKLRNIGRNPRVALHLDSDGKGGDIVVVTGEARVVEEELPAYLVPEFVEKYGWGFERLRFTAEEFSARYSVPVRIRATGLRGH